VPLNLFVSDLNVTRSITLGHSILRLLLNILLITFSVYDIILDAMLRHWLNKQR